MAEQEKIFSIKIDGVDDAIQELNDVEVALGKNKKRKKELLKIQQTENGLNAKQQKELRSLNKTIQQQTYEKGILNRRVKQGVKEINSEADSIDRLQSRVSRLTKEWSSLSGAERENTERGKALSAEIKSTNEKIREQKEGVGDNTSSIGNYENAINSALEANGLNNNVISRSIARYSTAKQSLVQLKDSLKENNKSTVSNTVSTNTNTVSKEGNIASSNQLTIAEKARAVATKASTIAVNLGSKSLKLFKIALISTGVGALVVALGALITYFTQTKQGVEAVNRITTALGATFQVIIDRFSTFGNAILKFFSGDIKGSAEEFKKSVEGIGEEIKKETTAAYGSEKALQALEDRNRKFIVTKERINAQIKEARRLSKDENIDIEERIKQVERARQLQKKISDEEVEIAEERSRLNKIQVEQGESLEEELNAQAELEAEVFRKKSQQASDLKTLLELENTLRNKQEAEQKKQVADRIKREKDLIKFREENLKQFSQYADSIIAKSKEAEKAIEEDILDDIDLSIAADTTEAEEWVNSWKDAQSLVKDVLDQEDFFAGLEEKQRRLDEARDKNLLSEEQYKDASIKIEEEKNKTILDITSNVLGQAADVFEEKTVAFKVLASAEALINTYLSATEAYAALAGIPVVGPALASIAAGTAIATGLANVAKINNVKFSRGGLIEGDLHENGGVPFTVNGKSGFEAEGGEVIINRKSAAMFPDELSAINEAGGGIAFANGGNIPKVNKSVSQKVELSDSSINAIVSGINDKKVINDPAETIRLGEEERNIQQTGDF